MTNFRGKVALELGLILFFVFGFSFLVNFLWEGLHAVYLYQKHDFDASSYVPMLLYASSFDSLIVLGLYFSVSVMWRNLFWIKAAMKKQILAFISIGIAMAAIIEIPSVFYYRRWLYKEGMPTVFGVGVSPLLQLSITGLLSVWLTRELQRGKLPYSNCIDPKEASRNCLYFCTQMPVYIYRLKDTFRASRYSLLLIFPKRNILFKF